MNIFDIIIVLLIILSGVSGFKQGILKSFVKLVGTLLVYFIAFQLKDKVGIILCKIFPFFSLDCSKATPHMDASTSAEVPWNITLPDSYIVMTVSSSCAWKTT